MGMSGTVSRVALIIGLAVAALSPAHAQTFVFRQKPRVGIAEPAPALSILLGNWTVPDAVVNEAWSLDLSDGTQVTLGAESKPEEIPNITWTFGSVTPLPWLGVAGDLLSGTPAIEGDFPVEVTATNGEATASKTITIRAREILLEAVDVSAGNSFTCAVTKTGGVKCWGAGNDGKLGDGNYSHSNVPIDVVGLPSTITRVAVGGNHACAIDSGGGVWCWGDGAFGQLGRGNGNLADSPIAIPASALASGATDLTADGNYTCAIVTGGRVRCWGANASNQLGNGTGISTDVPTDVPGLESGASSVVAGAQMACAVHGGDVKCWGTDPSSVTRGPTSVQNSAGITAVGIMANRSCGIRGADVVCWTGWGWASVWHAGVSPTSIASEGNHSCITVSGGGAKCWGSNTVGQLGNGNGTGATGIGDVAGVIEGFSRITAGNNTTCAVMASSRVRCWGNGAMGQLGNGANAHSPLPVGVRP